MYHYVYLIEFNDGMKYVGVHSTNIKPELDTRYLGSGRALPERSPETCNKRILGIYPDRASAIQAEKDYIISNNCCESDEFYNIRIGSFDLHGFTKKTSKGIAAAAEKLSGRIVGKMAKEAANHLKGEQRTPAQKAGAISMREKLTGLKNPKKAHKGIENSAFVPWYYITPQGEYYEVRNETKKDFAIRHDKHPNSVLNRCRNDSEHLKAKWGQWKGWTFGNLPISKVSGAA